VQLFIFPGTYCQPASLPALPATSSCNLFQALATRRVQLSRHSALLARIWHQFEPPCPSPTYVSTTQQQEQLQLQLQMHFEVNAPKANLSRGHSVYKLAQLNILPVSTFGKNFFFLISYYFFNSSVSLGPSLPPSLAPSLAPSPLAALSSEAHIMRF